MDQTLAQLINHIFDLEIENAQLKRQVETLDSQLKTIQAQVEEANHAEESHVGS